MPAPSGPYPIGTTELHLVDKNRKDPWGSGSARAVMASVWYPALPIGPTAPYAPAKVAAPLADELTTFLGLPAGAVDYAGTATHARSGAPALGRHPVEFPGGRVAPVTVTQDALKKAMGVRVADTRFLLDSLDRLAGGRNPDADHRPLPKGLDRALDLRRTGMFGYSAGGFAAAETMLVDRRIDAGVNFDGTMQFGFPEGELSESAKRGLDRPFLLFGAQGHSHKPQPGSPLNDPSWTSFWQHQRGWKLDLGIPNGTHGSFADYQFSVPAIAEEFGVPPEKVTELLGTVDPAGGVRAQRAYLGAYFGQFLRGVPQPILRHGSPRYPEVEFTR
ncbi:hypothetical protein FB561_2244 [Kribbella amoyensis]|uniref:Platelet-activating factor acetylhydrolase n=1 Tax=Kribbella amoyensis TaxID=996641 RepID=A0A561BQJ3_9ACTN|nr:lipase [Kribbella amoyensis]TWD81140.1 hypothetical protein FB561_2244 [Kribbella amoyensis]